MAKKDAIPVADVPLDESEQPVEERRAPDQDGAIEVAFVEGVLPEEDRREPELVMESSPADTLHAEPAFKALSGTPAPDAPRLPDTGDLIPKLNSP